MSKYLIENLFGEKPQRDAATLYPAGHGSESPLKISGMHKSRAPTSHLIQRRLPIAPSGADGWERGSVTTEL